MDTQTLYIQVQSDLKDFREDFEAGLFKDNQEAYEVAKARIDSKLRILEAEAEEYKEDEKFDFHPLQGEVV